MLIDADEPPVDEVLLYCKYHVDASRMIGTRQPRLVALPMEHYDLAQRGNERGAIVRLPLHRPTSCQTTR